MCVGKRRKASENQLRTGTEAKGVDEKHLQVCRCRDRGGRDGPGSGEGSAPALKPTQNDFLLQISVSALGMDGGADKLPRGVFLLHYMGLMARQSYPHGKQGEKSLQHQTALAFTF